MQNIFNFLPSLEGEEMIYTQELIKDMTDSQAQQFAMAYSARRKDPTTILLVALIGFIGFAGIHRFLLNQIGMGILYFFTAGCALLELSLTWLIIKDFLLSIIQKSHSKLH